MAELTPAKNRIRNLELASDSAEAGGKPRSAADWHAVEKAIAWGKACSTPKRPSRAGYRAALPLSRLPGVGSQQLFEITLEPEGGSTTGRPTGPILYVGRTVAL
ncbi:MAG: hypothetical protein M3Z31_11965 [Pseudomonadota bacterium]|nr:hypothetical protein [Pseudomonadota bacterium]